MPTQPHNPEIESRRGGRSTAEISTGVALTLPELATAINAAHDAAERTARTAIEHAHAAGDRLLLAKAQVDHGQWLPWLTANCPAVAARTASGYMRLARNWKTLEAKSAESADLSIDAALKLLNAPAEPDPDPDPDPDPAPMLSARYGRDQDTEVAP